MDVHRRSIFMDWSTWCAIVAVLLTGQLPGGASAAAESAPPRSASVKGAAPRPSPRVDNPLMFSGPRWIRGRKALYLTFDDGPAGGDTVAVANALVKSGVKATFFVVGQLAASPRGQKDVRHLVRSGMTIGMHSWSHASMGGWSARAVKTDFQRTGGAIRRASTFAPTCFRPPYGAYGSGILSAARERRVRVVQWDVDPTDWRNPGASAVVSRVVAHLHPGAIILMHDGAGHGRQAAAALPRIVRMARARGYVFGLLCTPTPPTGTTTG